MSDYKCTSVGCYDFNSSQMHQNILALQNSINRFSPDSQFGFSPIAVDGVIGKGSTQALLLSLTNLINMQTSGSQTGGLVANQAQGFYDQINTPEDVMTAMGDLVPFMQSAADTLGLDNVSAPMVASNPTKSISPTGARSGATYAAMLVNKPAVAGGILDSVMALPTWAKALGVLLVVGGGAAAYKHHKATR